MFFKFNLNQAVILNISGEQGLIIARAEYVNSVAQYYVHYKDGNGCAKTEWLYENQLEATA